MSIGVATMTSVDPSSGLNMAEASGSSSPDAEDRDFEPTAELLVHDYDDEGTMEEEENMSNDSGDNDEIDDLQKEGDMPLDDLLARYGYDPVVSAATANQESHSHSSTSEEDILNNHDLTLDKEEVARDILKHDDGSETSLEDLMDNVPAHDTLTLLNGMGDGDEEDDDYLPTMDEEVWKKNIQVGEEYQAVIPDLLDNESTTMTQSESVEENLLWSPHRVDESEVTAYLRNVGSLSQSPAPGQGSGGSATEPTPDDEQALYSLLQSSFDPEAALEKCQHKVQTSSSSPSGSDPFSSWSEEECQSFESGLRVYGKNFFAIQQNKVKTRTVGELVQFYYFWKKTERREAFCNRGRIEKKKYSVNPGVTDYVDRLCEKAEEEFSPSHSPLSTNCNCEPEQQQDTAPPPLPPQHPISNGEHQPSAGAAKRGYAADETDVKDYSALASDADDYGSKRIRMDHHGYPPAATAGEVGN